MPLRLVHLSDIHFQGYEAGWDEDADQRGELLRDLTRLIEEGGPAHGILVGGDIAFSAQPDEYATAAAWLDDVLKVAGGLDTSRVWTVPGNHDVDRSVLGRSPAARDFRTAIRGCEPTAIDVELRDRLSRDPAADGILEALHRYNDFASNYSCPTSAASPHWVDESLSFDGVPVQLTGLNSVLTSDKADSKTDERCRLILGSHQCRIARKDGVLRIAFAHHPPPWIRDWQLVRPYLYRAHLLLFGHEHAYAANQQEALGTVEVLAGAVAPERTRDGQLEPFVPTYNMITIDRVDANRLTITIEPRSWSRGDTCFDLHRDGVARFEVALDVERDSSATSTAVVSNTPASTEEVDDAAAVTSAAPLTTELPEHGSQDAEHLEERDELRRVGVAFMGLPATRRLEIARLLDVLDDEVLQLPQARLYPTLLRRIRDAGVIDRLIEELGNV